MYGGSRHLRLRHLHLHLLSQRPLPHARLRSPRKLFQPLYATRELRLLFLQVLDGQESEVLISEKRQIFTVLKTYIYAYIYNLVGGGGYGTYTFYVCVSQPLPEQSDNTMWTVCFFF